MITLVCGHCSTPPSRLVYHLAGTLCPDLEERAPDAPTSVVVLTHRQLAELCPPPR